MVGLVMLHPMKENIEIKSNKIVANNNIGVRVADASKQHVQQRSLRWQLLHLDFAPFNNAVKARGEWAGWEFADQNLFRYVLSVVLDGVIQAN